MLTRKFWVETAERAVKTAAQVLTGFVVVDVAVWDIDWTQAFGVTATAVALSVLTSVGSAGAGEDHESPSAVK